MVLRGCKVDHCRFVTNHLGHNRKKCRICEVYSMVDVNIGGIKHELEIIIQISMSDCESIFVSNIVEECTNFFFRRTAENRIVLARSLAKPEPA